MPNKCIFTGSKLTWNSKPLVDESSPDFFSLNAGGIAIVCIAGRFWISSAVPEIFAIKVWSGPKLTEILHVFGLQIFWGSAPEFLEWDYKNQPDSDHVAKFQGDRSRELGERLAKQKKKEDTSRVKQKTSRSIERAAYNNVTVALNVKARKI